MCILHRPVQRIFYLEEQQVVERCPMAYVGAKLEFSRQEIAAVARVGTTQHFLTVPLILALTVNVKLHGDVRKNARLQDQIGRAVLLRSVPRTAT